MRRTSVIARACAATLAFAALPGTAAAQSGAPIPVIVVTGRGHGHGVGMAQDGALAMGSAGATTAQILDQFYPGTTIGKGSGAVRVPVFSGNNVELAFPDGGEIRGYPAAANPPGATLPVRVAPGGRALLYRDGDATRVRALPPQQPATTTSSALAPTTSSSVASTTSSTAPLVTTTTRALFPSRNRESQPTPTIRTTTTAPPVATTTSTTTPPPVALVAGQLTAVPNGDGRVGVTPRDRRYRGVMEVSPTGGGLRFVNNVAVETYLKGMGEVRNPKWPASGLQAQAIAARTYALRAMAFGGELCDTQRCQVYIGADAEYAEMNKAVADTAGQVLMFGNAMASAVYSANGGGHSASREEGFGVAAATIPYLRPAPYPTTNKGDWSITISLRDVARHLQYRGEVTAVEVVERGPSGRAIRVVLRGDKGDVAVSGLQFDAALGLKSTLFQLRVTTATKVATITGGSVLQAPPEEASAATKTQVVGAPDFATPTYVPLQPVGTEASTAVAGAVAVLLLAAVSLATLRARRHGDHPLHAELS